MSATEKTIEAIQAMANAIDENHKILTKLDSAIGDGDHGTNMRRGFAAVLEKLDESHPNSPSDVLKTVAMTLISKVGGAAGPLYGTAFLRASSVAGRGDFAASDVAGAIEAALGGIKQRGKAEPGDKTMVDALEPAARAAKDAADSGGSSAEVLRAAAEAASEGAEATVPLTAKRGRASYLGPRSAGHKDPGATSTALLLDAAAKSLGG